MGLKLSIALILLNAKTLKSDHFGIETNSGQLETLNMWVTKIRPFWDWNYEKTTPIMPDIKTKIRPFWDWNGFTCKLLKVDCATKIRPFWDWNFHFWQWVGGLVWLKSDHFGIETDLNFWSMAASSWLKSDHFGIETINDSIIVLPHSILKSDHFGIETAITDIVNLTLEDTKIRPFWDWNGR